jgi:hypothetical protein
MALLDWFGPSRTEIWRKLSAQLGGAYTPKTWLRSDRIDVQHEHWVVTLDTYTVHANNTHVPYTRLRAPFRDREGFRCKVSRKWLKLQDVATGDEPFDRAFVIKTNDERKVRAFLDHAELRRLLTAQKAITLSVEDHEGWFGPKFPADCDELRLVVGGHLKDLERLRALFALFAIAPPMPMPRA